MTTEALVHFAVRGALWTLLAAAWAAACLWVERDAHEIFGRSRFWKGIVTLCGVVFFVATCLGGFGWLPELLPLVPLAVVSYLLAREAHAAPEDLLARRAARGLGIEAHVERFLPPIGGRPAVAKAAVQIVLLKKNGQPYDGRDEGDLDRETSTAIRSVQGILLTALQMRATDIHMEPKAGDEMQIRYRIDGIMQTISTLSGAMGRAVVSATKVLGDMDIAERRLPQDGTFAALFEGRKYDIRAASGPTSFGEKMSLRLLDSDGGIVKAGLDGIGMRESMLKTLRAIINQPDGMLIVCGPTGSGKTTTLYSAISEIDVLSRNILTIEDPIEYRLENISQTAVNTAAGLTFAKILRSVLRQDPDVILVGEIRDKETAEIAMEAAVTGHFVFSTLHSNDTATTVTRLLDMGIEATRIQAAVTAVLGQRLLRVLCPKCKQAYRPAPEDLRRYGIPADRATVFYRENDKGCPECNGTGFRGRTGIYELMVFDKGVRDLLIGRPSIEDLRAAARRAGMRTLRESALMKVVEGVTSLSECARVAK